MMMERADFADAARIYAIGDIHGRSDLLDRMVDAIARDLDAFPCAGSLTVTLGDYVDRGPDSRGVIDRLSRNPFPTAYLALKGNHEELFLACLRDPLAIQAWRHIGGLETFRSYGVDITALIGDRKIEQAGRELRDALPPAHADFLGSLELSLTAGRYFLCHAGVRPGVPLDRQAEQDLLWIREPFLDGARDFGKIVVHGHTPREMPEHLPHRINIDTGAFMTGRLTCAVLEPDGVRFLSTK